MEAIAEILEYPWRALPDSVIDQDIASMLSLNERKMLHWLAAHVALHESCIVDAGCFIGGSTASLASGLAFNRTRAPASRIVVYDIFVAPDEAWSLRHLPGRGPGHSIRDLFDANLSRFAALLDVRAGDFADATPPDGKIAICFLDIAKSWELNDRAVSELFAHLVPGRSILIQQDYNDHSCPWVNVTMARFAEHFTYLCDEGSSRVYRYERPIPQQEFERPLRDLGMEQIIALARQEADTCGNEISRFFNLVSLGWLIFEEHGADAAISHLQSISHLQPWHSDEPYVQIPIGGIRLVSDIAGLRSYEKRVYQRDMAAS